MVADLCSNPFHTPLSLNDSLICRECLWAELRADGFSSVLIHGIRQNGSVVLAGMVDEDMSEDRQKTARNWLLKLYDACRAITHKGDAND